MRDHPWDLAGATWIPLTLLAILAAILSQGIQRKLPIAVVDADRSAMSREYIRLLRAAPAIEIAAQPTSLATAFSMARSLRVYAVVYIPATATRDLQRGNKATVFCYYNGSYRAPGQAVFSDVAAATRALGASIGPSEIALVRGPGTFGTGAGVVALRTTTLFNSARSFEHYLVALLHPAVLHLALCICVIAALGRELRDATAGAWLDHCGHQLAAAIAGKTSPYLLLFTLYGAASLTWLVVVRDGAVGGNIALLLIGQVLLFSAYAAIALLLIGLTKSMGQSLSLAGLYAGTSLPFSGGTFPLEHAPLFTRIWSALMPFTAYVKVQAQQLDVGTPLGVTIIPLAVLMAFVVLAGGGGLWLFGRAALDPAAWGRR